MSWAEESTPWKWGPWSCQLRGDEIADLSFRGQRVLRSVRAVVRDSDWNTADWNTVDWAAAAWAVGTPAAAGAGVGTLRFPLQSSGYGSDICGELLVEATDDSLTATFTARSNSDFETNRTGLIVLHQAELSGTDLKVRHPKGSATSTSFPISISPHQPVRDIAGLAWADGELEVDIDFSGDVFEMEDQRNWTDASYKTYNRPLDLPFPYTLKAGADIRQAVTVTVREAPHAPAPSGAVPTETTALTEATALQLVKTGTTFPHIGVAVSEAPDPVPQLPAPPGSELLVELDLRTTNWRALLRRAAGRGLPLDVRLVVATADPSRIAAAAEQLKSLDIARIAVFDSQSHISDAASVAALRTALEAAGITAPIVGGSRSHFTELNREQHRIAPDLDGIITTVTPLFHSLSTAQLIESVAMQRIVAEQTLTIAGGLPVWGGPIALRPRFNNVATQPQPRTLRDDLSEGSGAALTGSADPRQSAPELAAWVIASVAALAVPGIAGITYFEEWGPRGVRAADGTAFPVAAALDAIAASAGAELLTGTSPDGRVWAVGASAPDCTRVLAANLDAVQRSLSVECPGREPVQIKLEPFAWAQVTLP